MQFYFRAGNVTCATGQEQTEKEKNSDSCHEVELLALDWGGHSKKSNNIRLKSNRFIWNQELKGAALPKLVIPKKPVGL